MCIMEENSKLKFMEEPGKLLLDVIKQESSSINFIFGVYIGVIEVPAVDIVPS